MSNTPDWHRIDADTYQAKYDSGTYRLARRHGMWTLWFQPNLTRGFLRKPGSWESLAAAKNRATVYDNDRYLNRSG